MLAGHRSLTDGRHQRDEQAPYMVPRSRRDRKELLAVFERFLALEIDRRSWQRAAGLATRHIHELPCAQDRHTAWTNQVGMQVSEVSKLTW
jgi:hypothetical protein